MHFFAFWGQFRFWMDIIWVVRWNGLKILIPKHIWKSKIRLLTLFIPAFLGLNYAGGGQICPHPLTMGYNGREVPKLSWNLISYRDWCQTKGFTTFRYLEPSKLMGWKTDFFWWFLRFVRVPPYEIWANWTNFFLVYEKTVIFLGPNLLYPLPHSKWGKVTKNCHVYTHTHTRIHK